MRDRHEVADGEDGQSAATDQGGGQHRGGAPLVGESERPAAFLAFADSPAEPSEEMERVVDGDSQRGAGGHHRTDLDENPAPAHVAEDEDDREQVRGHRQESRQGAAERGDHHQCNHAKSEQEALGQVVEKLPLRLVDQRDHPGVRRAGGRLGHGSQDRFDVLAEVVGEVGIVDVAEGIEANADPPALLAIDLGDEPGVDELPPGALDARGHHRAPPGVAHRASAGQRRGERGGRHRRPDVVKLREAALQPGYRLHLFEETERGRCIESDDDLQRDQRSQVLLHPAVVADDLALLGEAVLQFDRRLEPRQAAAEGRHRDQAGRGDRPVVAADQCRDAC